jgi:hypothetical protein
VSDVHVLDEAQDVPAAAEVARHGEDAVLVQASLDDHVHLDRREPGRGRRLDAREHALDGGLDVVHGAEDLVVEGVEAHGHAPQSGGGERVRLLRQEGAVRRHRQVEPGDAREHLDEPLHLPAHERLPAREPDLLDAVGDEEAGEAFDLFERQELAPLEKLEVAAVDLLRHAVDAAEVAPVGDRDAQVAQGPLEAVESIHANRVSRRRR